MGRNDSEQEVLARTCEVWPMVRDALNSGIKTAVHLHDAVCWDPLDDKHLYQHMIRRKAVEVFKDLVAEFDEDRDSALSMSGLILRLERDVVRIWHVTGPEIPKPGTKTKRDFVAQPPSGQMALFDLVTQLRHRDDRNHLVLRWTVHDHAITRFDLIRPAGVKKGKVVVDWEHDLLKDWGDTLS